MVLVSSLCLFLSFGGVAFQLPSAVVRRSVVLWGEDVRYNTNTEWKPPSGGMQSTCL